MDGMLVLEVINSNPNGDPDRENYPRQRDNGIGIISPVSVKRKLRDLIEYKENNFIWEKVSDGLDEDSFKIMESKSNAFKELTDHVNKDFVDFSNTYWDARLFGNTLLEKGRGDTIRAGALHFGLGMSVSPVTITEDTFTKKAPAQKDKKSGMAPSAFKIVEYGIYTVPFFFSPFSAIKTGCKDVDVSLCLRLMPYMYEHTKSMLRSQVNILHAHVGWHGNKSGTFKPFEFLKALCPTKLDGTVGDKKADFIIPIWDDVKELVPNVDSYEDASIMVIT